MSETTLEGFTDSTSRQYQSAIKSFINWGGFLPCDSEMILSFIESMGAINRHDRLKVSSLKVYRSALKLWHEEAMFEDPTLDKKIDKSFKRLQSLERQNGIYKDASRFITPEEGLKLITLLVVMTDDEKALRERLITAVSLMAGHRTSMIAKIKVDHIMNLGVSNANIVINTPSFKTDTEEPTVIPYTGGHFCPASWVRHYVKSHGIKSGWLFESQVNKGEHLARQTINDIAKRTMSLAGIHGGKLTSTSFRKTMATMAAMQGVDSLAIAAQGSWASVETINKHYLSKAMALKGDAPLAVIQSITDASNAIDFELGGLVTGQPKIETFNTDQLVEKFIEMRQGYWDLIFHTDLTIEEKRGFTSYFRSADKYVTEYNGDSVIDQFNETWTDCIIQNG